MVCMQDARKRPSISGSQVLLLLCVYRCSHRDLSPMQYQAPCSWSSGMVSWWAKVCVLSSWQGTICNRTVDLIIPPPPISLSLLYSFILQFFFYSPVNFPHCIYLPSLSPRNIEEMMAKQGEQVFRAKVDHDGTISYDGKFSIYLRFPPFPPLPIFF